MKPEQSLIANALSAKLLEVAKIRGIDFWQRFLEIVCYTVGCEAGSFYTLDEKRRLLTISRAVGPFAGELRDLSFYRQGCAGWCSEKREALISNDAEHDNRFCQKVDKVTGFKTLNLICVPTIHKDAVIGVLELMNKCGGDFTEEDKEFLLFMCAFAAETAAEYNKSPNAVVFSY